MGWSATSALTYPYDGIVDFDVDTGKILEVDELRGSNGFKVDDIIAKVDDIPFREAQPFYLNKEVGQTAEFVIKRGGREESLSVKLTNAPIDAKVTVGVIAFIALVFWLTGAGVLAFKPGDATSSLFFLFTQVIASLLMAGLFSAVGPGWTSRLFNFLLWLIGPMLVHFHMHFPQKVNLRGRRVVTSVLYALALIGGLPVLLLPMSTIRHSEASDLLTAVKYLYLALNLLAVVGLLIHAYRHSASPNVRGKIRIVLLGGGLSLLPSITLFLLPSAIRLPPIIPYYIAFLFLLILPLTYGYAIIRHRLIEIDRHVNRGATFIVVFSVLGGLYALILAARSKMFSESLANDVLFNTLSVLILASIFPTIYQRIKRIVDSAFYGSWYDYRSAVSQITQGLEQITDLSQLAKTISHRLVKTLQLEDACVFLKDLDGGFSVIEVAPPPKSGEGGGLAFSALPKNSLSYLLNIGAIGRDALRRTLSEVKLTPEEHQLLDSDQIYLWVPAIGHGQVLGLLALGSKLGADVFSGEDMDILRIVARQMGPLIENIHLVTRLRQYAAELERRVQERTAELHAEKERVEAVLSSVGDGVIVTDLDGRIMTVNRAYEDQSGFSESDVVGKPLYAFLDGQEDFDRSLEIREALQKENAWSGELVAHRKGGRLYDIIMTLEPFRDQAGEILGYVGSQRDITQYKELERLKDQFILEVSHELRTPVTNMGLFAELLERGRPEKKTEYMSILKSEINMLMKMIEDILDLSRLEVGKYKRSTFKHIDMNLLIDQVVAAHQPLAQEGALELAFFGEADLPRIYGEQNQIARVLTNLLSNAIRYTPSGHVHVRSFAADGGVWVEVEDTGIGIDPIDFPHIFERFYRGQKVSQSKIIGSGLGLAIVSEIMQLHDGDVDFSSESGKGSTFRIWFPFESQAVAVEAV
jgi:PAS domain S-box-containing protein